MQWLRLFRRGDWVIVFLGCAFAGSSFPLAWQHGTADRAQVRLRGEVFGEFDLARNRVVDVPGPLGMTRIAIENRRVRVISDPGSHQYCVRQGWLQRPGEIAICAPNQVSVQIVGTKEVYDSLSY